MLNIKVEGNRMLVVTGEDWFCTVFPHDPDEMPQDFPSWEEAEIYGDEHFGRGNYMIESPC